MKPLIHLLTNTFFKSIFLFQFAVISCLFVNKYLQAQQNRIEVNPRNAQTKTIQSTSKVSGIQLSSNKRIGDSGPFTGNFDSRLNTRLIGYENRIDIVGNKTASSCNDADTIDYLLEKFWRAEGFQSNWTDSTRNYILNSQSNEFGQWFPNPSGINVEGFGFWARSVSNSTVNITCNLYNAGFDSLPSGFPVQTINVPIDGNYIYRNAIFNVPVSLLPGNSYIITIKYNVDDVQILGGDNLPAQRPTGLGEWLSCVKLNNIQWYRSYDINSNGYPLDADFLFHPIVKYSLPVSFSFNPNCLPSTAPFQVGCINGSDSLFSSRFYNLYAFKVWSSGILFPSSPLPVDSTFLWNFGDLSPVQYASNPTHTYSIDTNYIVTLDAKLRRWYPNIVCSNTYQDTLSFSPKDLILTSDQSICEGDSVILSVQLGGGSSFIRTIEHTNGTNTTVWPNSQGGGIATKTVFPTNTTIYTIRGGYGSCGNKWLNGDSLVTINVDPKPLDNILSGDQTICEGDLVQLSVQLGGSPTLTRAIKHSDGANVIIWPNSSGGNLATQFVQPSTTTTYTLNASYSLCGNRWLNSDSVVIITVNPKPNPVILGVDTLSVTGVTGPASYQWQLGGVDILGANSQTYIPTLNGLYSVAVSQNSCTDTSSTVSVIVSNQADSNSDDYINLFPNPSTGQLNVSSFNPISMIEFYSPLGQKVKTCYPMFERFYRTNVSDLSSGLYWVRVYTGNNSVRTISFSLSQR